MQLTAIKALQFLCNSCRLSNVTENIHGMQHFRLVNTFHHVGKPIIIAQKLQRVACN